MQTMLSKLNDLKVSSANYIIMKTYYNCFSNKILITQNVYRFINKDNRKHFLFTFILILRSYRTTSLFIV